ncbi:hypothetical protein ADUPG1_012247 [Aduncisulcus paluster]|uniref:RRM domain-containing protein n=1 Tax=Aduncisulcus paluster TaxID=2918883 RepID=A0ABQ5JYT7_9EUKA|nr:hypothetical protein ADUPG1_012247 [Aduncisulcus paluster]
MKIGHLINFTRPKPDVKYCFLDYETQDEEFKAIAHFHGLKVDGNILTCEAAKKSYIKKNWWFHKGYKAPPTDIEDSEISKTKQAISQITTHSSSQDHLISDINPPFSYFYPDHSDYQPYQGMDPLSFSPHSYQVIPSHSSALHSIPTPYLQWNSTTVIPRPPSISSLHGQTTNKSYFQDSSVHHEFPPPPSQPFPSLSSQDHFRFHSDSVSPSSSRSNSCSRVVSPRSQQSAFPATLKTPTSTDKTLHSSSVPILWTESSPGEKFFSSPALDRHGARGFSSASASLQRRDFESSPSFELPVRRSSLEVVRTDSSSGREHSSSFSGRRGSFEFSSGPPVHRIGNISTSVPPSFHYYSNHASSEMDNDLPDTSPIYSFRAAMASMPASKESKQKILSSFAPDRHSTQSSTIQQHSPSSSTMGGGEYGERMNPPFEGQDMKHEISRHHQYGPHKQTHGPSFGSEMQTHGPSFGSEIPGPNWLGHSIESIQCDSLSHEASQPSGRSHISDFSARGSSARSICSTIGTTSSLSSSISSSIPRHYSIPQSSQTEYERGSLVTMPMYSSGSGDTSSGEHKNYSASGPYSASFVMPSFTSISTTSSAGTSGVQTTTISIPPLSSASLEVQTEATDLSLQHDGLPLRQSVDQYQSRGGSMAHPERESASHGSITQTESVRALRERIEMIYGPGVQHQSPHEDRESSSRQQLSSHGFSKYNHKQDGTNSYPEMVFPRVTASSQESIQRDSSMVSTTSQQRYSQSGEHQGHFTDQPQMEQDKTVQSHGREEEE